MSTSKTDLSVKDVMLPASKISVVQSSTILKEVLEQMNASRLGISCVVDDNGVLLGIFTDGDIRRMLLKDQKPFSALFSDDVVVHATKEPTTINSDATLVEAVVLMEEREIWDLPVVESNGRLIGLLHLHPAIKSLLDI